MTSHVDAETLALSAEGLLDPEKESSVQGHLAGCQECNEQLTALTDVSRLLGEVPAPELPAGVATRIEEALQAEVERRVVPASMDAEPPLPSVAEGGSVVPFTKRPGRWLPYLVGAAAAVFVIGGAGAVLHSIFGSDGADNAQSEVSDQGRPDAALSYHPVLLDSETEYTAEGLEDQAAEVLDTVPADDHPSAPEDAPEDEEGSSEEEVPETPADVSTCIQALAETNDNSLPAVVDIATFRASDGDGPSDAWVMYYGSDPAGEFEIIVVTPECANGDDTVLARTAVAGS